MKGKHQGRSERIDRRSFVSQAVKLAAFGTFLMPVIEACNNKKKTSATTNTLPGKGKPTTTTKKRKPRNNWSHEGLVMNSKTKTLHLPSSKVYRYYDPIKREHLQEMSVANFMAQFQDPVKLHKQQSGNILEILAMQGLRPGINDQSLAMATDILAKAFSTSCDNAKGFNLNSTNFRLHELMLQLISLNNSIPASEKWAGFSNRVKKPASLRKRQKWMETESAFNERVAYILNHQNDYLARLNQRAKKYSFT